MIQSIQKALRVRPGEKNRRGPGAIALVLLLILACQFAVLCWFNFTQIRNHMGYDSSWNYLRSLMMWQEKALTFHNWHDDTTLQLDTIMPLASLLYGITGNIWLAFGIANTVMTVLLLLAVWKLLDRLDVGLTARLTACNLVICPFLTNGYTVYNDLGYFSSMLSGASFYSLRILMAVLIVSEFLKISRGRKMGAMAGVIWAGCVLCGLSSGVYLAVIVLGPLLAYAVEKAMIRGEWKVLWRKECVFVLLCCAFVAAGKAAATAILHFRAIDSEATWTALTRLGVNFGSLIPGLMKLLQVLPLAESNFAVVSVRGFLRMGALGIFALTSVAAVLVSVRALRKPEEDGGAGLLFFNIAAINLLVLGLHNASYGTTIFEERYMIIVFFAAVIMTAMFFDRLEGRRVVSVLLPLAMAGSLFLVDVHSDINYLQATNDAWPMDEIQALAESQDAGIVYVWGDDLTVISRSLRVWDPDRVYKSLPDAGGYYRHHFGDYLTYDTNEEYTGPTLLVCPAGQNLVPESVLAEYTLLDDSLGYTVLKVTGGLEVYVSDHNPKLW